MARRLRDHQKESIRLAAVEHLMRLAGGNMNVFALTDRKLFSIDLHDCLALQNKEELLGLTVEVSRLLGARRHALVDDAE